MFCRPILITLMLALCVALPAARAATPPVEAYAGLPQLADIEISPNGTLLAARVAIDNEYRLAVLQQLNGQYQIVYLLSEDAGFSTKWFYWANDETLLISFGFVKERRHDVETQERRLYALRMTDKELLPLFRQRRGERPLQFQDRIVSFLPDDPDHILVQYNRDDPSKPDVYRITVNERSRHVLLVPGKPTVRRWLADNDGVVRLGRGIDGNGDNTLFVRLAGNDNWTNFSHRVENPEVIFRPVGFATEPNLIYALSGHETDPAGLYTFDLATDSFVDKIYSHPNVDIDAITIDRESGELLSIVFYDTEIDDVYFGRRPIYDAINALSEQLSGRLLGTVAISRAGDHAVLRAYGARDAGQYLVLDAAKRSVTPMPQQYAALPDDVLGITVPAEYTARDGLTIPAFITLPPDLTTLADARGLPFVVYPHGGPASRDFLTFRYKVQFMASLGYGVLQMNFRGSSGYGQAFRDAGDKEWGQAMQDDIEDGTRWLIEQGYADPSRIAIAGGSYGGYAALMGVVKSPDLYQCAISFAGVSDLPDLIERERTYVDGQHRARFIGRLWRDRKRLAENSPAQRADAIKVPVLLIHGDRDTIVHIEQSELMAKRLRAKDKLHDFIVLKDGDHYLSRYQHRLRYLQETKRFLGNCLAQ